MVSAATELNIDYVVNFAFSDLVRQTAVVSKCKWQKRGPRTKLLSQDVTRPFCSWCRDVGVMCGFSWAARTRGFPSLALARFGFVVV